MTLLRLGHCIRKRHQRCVRYGWRAFMAIAILGWPINKIAPEVREKRYWKEAGKFALMLEFHGWRAQH